MVKYQNKELLAIGVLMDLLKSIDSLLTQDEKLETEALGVLVSGFYESVDWVATSCVDNTDKNRQPEEHANAIVPQGLINSAENICSKGALLFTGVFASHVDSETFIAALKERPQCIAFMGNTFLGLVTSRHPFVFRGKFFKNEPMILPRLRTHFGERADASIVIRILKLFETAKDNQKSGGFIQRCLNDVELMRCVSDHAKDEDFSSVLSGLKDLGYEISGEPKKLSFKP